MLAAQCEADPEATLAFLQAGRAAGALTVLNAAPAPGCSAELLAAADVVAAKCGENRVYPREKLRTSHLAWPDV